MNNIGKFQVGIQFIGNVNNVKMEVVKIEKPTGTGEIAIIRAMETGKIFTYGLKALERCNVTIIN